MNYKPVCPRGYDDCIWDPAYIFSNYPDWYKKECGSCLNDKFRRSYGKSWKSEEYHRNHSEV